MKRLLAPVLILALVGLGCNLFNAAPAPPSSATPFPTLPFLATQTAPPFPTLTQPAARTPTQAGSGAATLPPNFTPTSGSRPTSTPPPTVTAHAVTATRPAPTAAASSTGEVTRLRIFLIALEDNGASGDPVGCGDSLIPVTVEVPRTQAVLRAALTRLLSLRDAYYGQSGLYNALYQSNLAVESLAIQNGEAVLHLTGELLSGGVCDDPRIISQLEQTALQFSTVQRVTIWINDVKIQDLLSGRGG